MDIIGFVCIADLLFVKILGVIAWMSAAIGGAKEKARAAGRALVGPLQKMITALPPPRDPFALIPVVVYLRYSTPGQRPASLKRQLAVIEADARRLGLRIVKVFKDEGVSGRLLHRKGLDDAIAFCKAGGARGILVEDCDRLARKCSIIPVLWDDLNDYGCTLWDRRQGAIDTEIKAAIFSAVAAAHHRRLIEVTTHGRRQRVEESGPWRAPYGFMINPFTEELMLHPVNSVIVKEKIFYELVAGRSDGDIARSLNEQGVPTPSADRKNAAKRWTESAVTKIRTNAIHKRQYIYGRDQAKSGLPYIEYTLPEELRVVDDDVWELANAMAEARSVLRAEGTNEKRRQELARTSADYLKDKVHCSICNRSMKSMSDQKFPGQRQFFCLCAEVDKRPHRVKGVLIRQCVGAALARELSSDLFKARFKEFAAIANKSLGNDLRLELSTCLEEIRQIELEVRDSWEDQTWGEGFSRQWKKDRRTTLEERKEKLEIECADLSSKIEVELVDDRRIAKLAPEIEEVIQSSLALNPRECSVMTTATLRAILHKVVVTQHENGRFDVTVLLAPAGDGERKAPKTLPITFRYFASWRVDRPDHEFLVRLRKVIADGGWRITDDDLSALLAEVPALRECRPNWEPDEYRSFVQSVVIGAQKALPYSALGQIHGNRSWNSPMYYAAFRDFETRGGMLQLKLHLEQGGCPALGTIPEAYPKNAFTYVEM